MFTFQGYPAIPYIDPALWQKIQMSMYNQMMNPSQMMQLQMQQLFPMSGLSNRQTMSNNSIPFSQLPFKQEKK